MEWEPSAGAMSFAFFPGEAPFNGAGTLGGNGMKGPFRTPGNLWSEPELYGFLTPASLRAVTALYDAQERIDGAVPDIPNGFQSECRLVTNSPRSWRDSQVFNTDYPVVAVAGLVTKTGTFLAPDGPAGFTQAITGLGFKPKAVLFWWGGSNASVDQATTQDTRFGMGFAASPSERGCHCSWIENAVGTANTSTLIRNDACIATVNGAATTPSGLWDLLSFDSDGFTVVVDLDPPTDDNRRISYIAFGGDDLTNVKGGEFAAPGAPGNAGVTGVGFQPDVVLMFWTGEGGPLPDDDASARYGFGAAVSASQQAVLYGYDEDAVGTINSERYSRFDECIFAYANTLAVQQASHVSMDVDGFTLNWIANTLAMPVLYLAMKGGAWYIGNSATADSLTTVPVSGFGFAPKGVLVASAVASAQQATGVPGPSLGLSVGAAHGTAAADQVAHGNFEEDGIGTSSSWFGIEYGAVYQNLSAPGLAGLMDVQSLDLDGITFEMLDADPTTRVFWYLAFGDTVVAAGDWVGGLSLLGVGQ